MNTVTLTLTGDLGNAPTLGGEDGTTFARRLRSNTWEKNGVTRTTA